MGYEAQNFSNNLTILHPKMGTYILPLRQGLWNPSFICLNPKYCDNLEKGQELIYEENIVGVILFRNFHNDQCSNAKKEIILDEKKGTATTKPQFLHSLI